MHCLCSSVTISRPHALWDFWNPRKNWPCTLQLDTSPGAGEGSNRWDLGELERSPSSVQLKDAWLPKSPARGRNHMAPWLGWCSQTCCLLWVGLLQVMPCLKAQAATERVCYLVNPTAAVWPGSCHVRPCGSSRAGRCSGCSFALK